VTVLKQYTIQGDSTTALVESIEAGVRTGALAPGTALPTVRALATSRGISPTTVAGAYAALRARGLLSTSGRRGTRISARPPLTLPLTRGELVPDGLRDLARGNPDPAFLPRLGRALRRLPDRQRVYGEPLQLPELIVQARQQFVADDIPADHLTVVSGAMDGVERVLLAHLRPGDRLAVEDPGYPAVLDLVAALGLQAEPVPLDEQGVTPEGLARALRAGAQACVLTPRAQNPTGAAFDPSRVRDLQRVLAAHPRTLVIEDDHAGVVAGAPALTLGPRERWAVVRSVSKSLGPDLRVALVTGDASTIARVEGRQGLGCGWVSHLLQRTVATLMADTTVQRGLRLAARSYAERRAALIESLARYGIEAQGRSGFNVWIPVREEALPLQALAAAGWALKAGERYRSKSGPALRVTIATLKPAEAERLAADMARALSPTSRGPTT
jgi:DNA-binding transcriptional MocR family regulator